MVKIKKNQRYLFYYSENLYSKPDIRIFRANFLTIINNHLIVEKYGIRDVVYGGYWTIPLEWIQKIETLEDILQKKLLPSEILEIIDSYL